jgi:hypothetical protein
LIAIILLLDSVFKENVAFVSYSIIWVIESCPDGIGDKHGFEQHTHRLLAVGTACNPCAEPD